MLGLFNPIHSSMWSAIWDDLYPPDTDTAVFDAFGEVTLSKRKLRASSLRDCDITSYRVFQIAYIDHGRCLFGPPCGETTADGSFRVNLDSHMCWLP